MPTEISTAVKLPVVKVGGTVLETSATAKVVEVEVDLSVRRTSTVRFVVDEGDADNDLTQAVARLGQKVEVDVLDKNVFKGAVTKVEVLSELGKVVTTVLASDASCRFATGFERLANPKSPKQLLEQIATRHELGNDISLPASIGDAYFSQTGSDRSMLDLLSARYGWEWFVKDEKLTVRERPAASGATEIHEGQLLQVRIDVQSVGLPHSVEAGWWDVSGATPAWTSSKHTSAKTDVNVGAVAGEVERQVGAALDAAADATVNDVAVASADEAMAVAQGRARRALADAVRLQATLGQLEPTLLPGSWVTFPDLGRGYGATSFYVTDVLHTYDGDSGRTEVRSGGVRQVSTAGGAAASGTEWSSGGPVVAVVTDLQDPDKAGRVKVKFPSLGDLEGDWARVASVGAGPEKRGVDFRPEVGDEVLVVFEHSDPRFPIVLGGLWNGSRHPAPGESKGETRIMRSKTGHVQFLDKDEQLVVGFGDIGGEVEKVTLDKAAGITLESSKDIVLKAGSTTLTLKQNGNIELKAGSKDVTVDGNKITLKGTGDVALTGLNVKTNANANVESKAGAMGKFEGGAMVEIKGALVKIN